jgi:hypothetical protein
MLSKWLGKWRQVELNSEIQKKKRDQFILFKKNLIVTIKKKAVLIVFVLNYFMILQVDGKKGNLRILIFDRMIFFMIL